MVLLHMHFGHPKAETCVLLGLAQMEGQLNVILLLGLQFGLQFLDLLILGEHVLLGFFNLRPKQVIHLIISDLLGEQGFFLVGHGLQVMNELDHTQACSLTNHRCLVLED